MTVETKHNHLAATEIGAEGNYNMIDGIINNMPKPSLLAQMQGYEKQIAENENTIDVDGGNRELTHSCSRQDR